MAANTLSRNGIKSIIQRFLNCAFCERLITWPFPVGSLLSPKMMPVVIIWSMVVQEFSGTSFKYL